MFVSGSLSQNADLRAALFTPASLLSRLGTSPSRKRNPKVPVAPPHYVCYVQSQIHLDIDLLTLQEHGDALGKRRRTSPECGELQEVSNLWMDGWMDALKHSEFFHLKSQIFISCCFLSSSPKTLMATLKRTLWAGPAAPEFV